MFPSGTPRQTAHVEDVGRRGMIARTAREKHFLTKSTMKWQCGKGQSWGFIPTVLSLVHTQTSCYARVGNVVSMFKPHPACMDARSNMRIHKKSHCTSQSGVILTKLE